MNFLGEQIDTGPGNSSHAVSLIFPVMLWLLFPIACPAQDLEPRRWSHLPVNMNFLGLGYGYSEEDIFFDPTLGIEDAESEISTVAVKYIRTFEFYGKSARIELMPVYQNAQWKGTLNGSPRTVNRNGFADPAVRLAVNLAGAPPLSREDFVAYRATTRASTIVGAALTAQLPVGQYYDDRLINLGGNRFVFRPEMGVVREWDNWSLELTGTVSFYTDNDNFFNGRNRQQSPYYGLVSQLVYEFYPAVWAGLGGGYGIGGESRIDGTDKDDERENLAWGATFGFPLAKKVSAKIGYIGSSARNSVGADSDNVVFTLVTNW